MDGQETLREFVENAFWPIRHVATNCRFPSFDTVSDQALLDGGALASYDFPVVIAVSRVLAVFAYSFSYQCCRSCTKSEDSTASAAKRCWHLLCLVVTLREQEVGSNTMRVERGFWQSILQVRCY